MNLMLNVRTRPCHTHATQADGLRVSALNFAAKAKMTRFWCENMAKNESGGCTIRGH